MLSELRPRLVRGSTRNTYSCSEGEQWNFNNCTISQVYKSLCVVRAFFFLSHLNMKSTMTTGALICTDSLLRWFITQASPLTNYSKLSKEHLSCGQMISAYFKEASDNPIQDIPLGFPTHTYRPNQVLLALCTLRSYIHVLHIAI